MIHAAVLTNRYYYITIKTQILIGSINIYGALQIMMITTQNDKQGIHHFSLYPNIVPGKILFFLF